MLSEHFKREEFRCLMLNWYDFIPNQKHFRFIQLIGNTTLPESGKHIFNNNQINHTYQLLEWYWRMALLSYFRPSLFLELFWGFSVGLYIPNDGLIFMHYFSIIEQWKFSQSTLPSSPPSMRKQPLPSAINQSPSRVPAHWKPPLQRNMSSNSSPKH